MARTAALTISLTPQVVSLSLYAGDGVSLRLVATDSLGVPIDLTGTVTAQIRESRTADLSLADFTVDLTDAIDGIVMLTLDGTQTAALHDDPTPLTNAPSIKGSVATVGDLPPSGNTTGDNYIVEADEHTYSWDGSQWVDQGPAPKLPPLPAFEGVWDVQWTPGAGELPVTLVQGSVESSLDVTRA